MAVKYKFMGTISYDLKNFHCLDARQNLFWSFYLLQDSATFSNATQSALRAGFKGNSAKQVVTTVWFKSGMQKCELLRKSKDVLEKTLDESSKDMKLAQDTAKFVARTLGKSDGFSERTEMTGRDGEAIEYRTDVPDSQVEKIITSYAAKINARRENEGAEKDIRE